MANKALTFSMKPSSLKQRLATKHTVAALKQAIVIPAGLSDDEKAAYEDARDEYILFVAYTDEIKTGTPDNAAVAQFMKWWASRLETDAQAHFEGYIGLPDVVILEWWEAYKGRDEFLLPIESKPPYLLTDKERAELDDPKALPPLPVGGGKSDK